MRFNPNYKTIDGWFEVMVDVSLLLNKPLEAGTYLEHWHNKEITQNKIIVYNTMTNRMSEKSIYFNENKGFYFKGSNSYWTKTPHSKYYIADLIPLKEENKNDSN
jgi:hypothetical protein